MLAQTIAQGLAAMLIGFVLLSVAEWIFIHDQEED